MGHVSRARGKLGDEIVSTRVYRPALLYMAGSRIGINICYEECILTASVSYTFHVI